MSKSESIETAGPVAPNERIDAVDIIRGFALFGVLMLNMLDFSGPVGEESPWAVSTSWWDKATELMILVLGESAFYTTFSFLFGLGFALQLERATSRGERFGWRFVSRLAVLFVFGLAHGRLIWDGDILLQYSVAGMFLLPFARVQPRTARRWAASLAAATLTIITGLITVFTIFDSDETGDADADVAQSVAENTALYRDSGFWDIAQTRLDELIPTLVIALAGSIWFVGLFLAGLWVVRSGKLTNWRNERAFVLSVLKVSIPVAIVGKGVLAFTIIKGGDGLTAGIGDIASTFVGGPALGATYVSLLVLALQKAGRVSEWLKHLAPVGRMALTNYLLQSVISVLFFYGYGLGNYGRFGVATTFLFTVALFAAQILFSRIWLNRFRFGPMEWLWRTLTYRQKITA